MPVTAAAGRAADGAGFGASRAITVGGAGGASVGAFGGSGFGAGTDSAATLAAAAMASASSRVAFASASARSTICRPSAVACSITSAALRSISCSAESRSRAASVADAARASATTCAASSRADSSRCDRSSSSRRRKPVTSSFAALRMVTASCIASATIWSRRERASISASRTTRAAFSSASASTARASASAALRCSTATALAAAVASARALLEDARGFGVGVGPDRRGLLGGGCERRLADPRGLGLGGDQLELRGEPSLTKRGDGLASQPLDLLLRAATLAGVLLLRHRAQGYGLPGPDGCMGSGAASGQTARRVPSLAQPCARRRGRGRRARPGRRRAGTGGRSRARRRTRRLGGVEPDRSAGARAVRALHRFGQRRVRGVDGSAAHPDRGRARHRRSARLAVGRPGGARSATVPGVVVQRRVQVGRLRRRRDRVRRVVPQPGRGRGVAHRVRRTARTPSARGGATTTPTSRSSRCDRTSACSSTVARPPRPRRTRARGARRSRVSRPRAVAWASTPTADWCGPADG